MGVGLVPTDSAMVAAATLVEDGDGAEGEGGGAEGEGDGAEGESDGAEGGGGDGSAPGLVWRATERAGRALALFARRTVDTVAFRVFCAFFLYWLWHANKLQIKKESQLVTKHVMSSAMKSMFERNHICSRLYSAEGGSMESAESRMTKKTNRAITPMLTRSEVDSMANMSTEMMLTMTHGMKTGYTKGYTLRSSVKRSMRVGTSRWPE